MSNPYATMMGYQPISYKPRGRSRVRRPAYSRPPRGGSYPKQPTVPKSAPKRRSGGSMTVTQTRRRQRLGKSVRTGQNSSVSYTNYGKWSPVNKRLLSRLTGHSIRELMLGSSSITNQGQQAATIFALLDRTDLEQLKVDSNGGTATENDVSLFMKTAKLKVHMKNQSNVYTKLTIYDIVTINPGYVTTIDTPTEAWNKGFDDMGTASQVNIVGATPYGSPEFRKLFRITKVTRVPLEPGQEHEHVVKKNMNWAIRSTKWANQTTANVKGLTYFCMIVWHGSLAHNTADPTQVTFAPSRLDYVIRRQYNYASLANNKPVYNVTDSIVKNIVDLDFMGEDQDRDLDPVNA